MSGLLVASFVQGLILPNQLGWRFAEPKRPFCCDEKHEFFLCGLCPCYWSWKIQADHQGVSFKLWLFKSWEGGGRGRLNVAFGCGWWSHYSSYFTAPSLLHSKHWFCFAYRHVGLLVLGGWLEVECMAGDKLGQILWGRVVMWRLGKVFFLARGGEILRQVFCKSGAHGSPISRGGIHWVTMWICIQKAPTFRQGCILAFCPLLIISLFLGFTLTHVFREFKLGKRALC